MLCILNSCTEPYFNLAAEEYVLKHFNDDIFMLWRNEPAVIIGKNQNAVAEINIEFVKENQIKVVRRQTGGGAVFHDLGNVNYTFIAPKDSGNFQTFSEPILMVLNKLGVNAKFEGRNDLTIDGRKFSGNAQCIHQNRILHHGTLLFSSKMEDLSAALRVNPLKFQDKAVKSVRKRVTNISEHLPCPMSVIDFINTVMKEVSATIPHAEPYSFSEIDVQNINQLKAEKYETWEWNFGSSPKFDFGKQIRTQGGNVEVALSVEYGRISNIRIYGDFFFRKDISSLEQLLINQEYKQENIQQLLTTINLDDYLCNVSDEEFIRLMF